MNTIDITKKNWFDSIREKLKTAQELGKSPEEIVDIVRQNKGKPLEQMLEMYICQHRNGEIPFEEAVGVAQQILREFIRQKLLQN